MDLSTTYMGLKLKNPLVASASPMSEMADTVKKMEDAGAAAVVMYSLFEEQLNGEKYDLNEYLDHIVRLKRNVSIPIIASVNGVSSGDWMQHAREMQDAGADAIELDVYYIPTDPNMSAVQVEEIYLDDIRKIKSCVAVPVAVKLNPYFSSFANMANSLDCTGADALVLFNRFYQPDIDIESLKRVPRLELSHSHEIQLTLHWIATLYGKICASLAATSGIHDAKDILKLVMAGADVTMIASALLKKGTTVIAKILSDMKLWMEKHEYASLDQIKGIMSYQNEKEPDKLVRANYIRTLQSYCAHIL
jgi:dihydroorotate dehydrogenase (fumarate)